MLSRGNCRIWDYRSKLIDVGVMTLDQSDSSETLMYGAWRFVQVGSTRRRDSTDLAIGNPVLSFGHGFPLIGGCSVSTVITDNLRGEFNLDFSANRGSVNEHISIHRDLGGQSADAG